MSASEQALVARSPDGPVTVAGLIHQIRGLGIAGGDRLILHRAC